jgi:hypothetical protein
MFMCGMLAAAPFGDAGLSNGDGSCGSGVSSWIELRVVSCSFCGLINGDTDGLRSAPHLLQSCTRALGLIEGDAETALPFLDPDAGLADIILRFSAPSRSDSDWSSLQGFKEGVRTCFHLFASSEESLVNGCDFMAGEADTARDLLLIWSLPSDAFVEPSGFKLGICSSSPFSGRMLGEFDGDRSFFCLLCFHHHWALILPASALAHASP